MEVGMSEYELKRGSESSDDREHCRRELDNVRYAVRRAIDAGADPADVLDAAEDSISYHGAT